MVKKIKGKQVVKSLTSMDTKEEYKAVSDEDGLYIPFPYDEKVYYFFIPFDVLNRGIQELENNKELKSILYKMIDLIDFQDRIGNLNDCNTCAVQRTCRYYPRPGEFTRINCFAWEGGKDASEK